MTENNPLTTDDKKWLLGLARKVLEALPEQGESVPDLSSLSLGDIPESVKPQQGAFVTLHTLEGQLRGCIGYVTPVAPLYRTVVENTVNAARRDPRFPPVKPSETSDIEIEISAMTPPREIDSIDEIEVGKHGLIINRGLMRGLLLPQVATEYGWDKETFLNHTCLKAGLPETAWKDDRVKIEVFSADVFSESNLKS